MYALITDRERERERERESFAAVYCIIIITMFRASDFLVVVKLLYSILGYEHCNCVTFFFNYYCI